jgi:hypothetical protein
MDVSDSLAGVGCLTQQSRIATVLLGQPVVQGQQLVEQLRDVIGNGWRGRGGRHFIAAQRPRGQVRQALRCELLEHLVEGLKRDHSSTFSARPQRCLSRVGDGQHGNDRDQECCRQPRHHRKRRVAARPAPHTFDRRDAPSEDRDVIQEALQISGEFGGR